ncbi:MAG: hypothetical protein ABI321_10465 [Polyangia bacterium]
MDDKKPGSRDISDLKARLGLKKTGTMQTVTPGGEPTAPPPSSFGGSSPAPQAPSAIPSPFGQPAPVAVAPAAPAPPPDPRRDPFASAQAANLAAFYGMGQALPGSAEGVGEPMDKPKPWGRIAGYVVAGVAVFLGGTVWGGISSSRRDFNETTDQAIVIRNEVEKQQKVLESIIAALSKKTQGGVDLDQATQMATVAQKKPDTKAIFHANYQHLETLEIDRLFSYYSNTNKLYDLIEAHAKKTLADKDAIQKYLDKAKSDKNYAVILDTSGPIQLAKFVEVGGPVCPTPGDTSCSPDVLKFSYRMEAGAQLSTRPVKGKPGETIIPLQQTPLFKTVASGSTDALAAEAYGRRRSEIVEIVAELEKTSKELLPELKKTAERPHVFTF